MRFTLYLPRTKTLCWAFIAAIIISGLITITYWRQNIYQGNSGGAAFKMKSEKAIPAMPVTKQSYQREEMNPLISLTKQHSQREETVPAMAVMKQFDQKTDIERGYEWKSDDCKVNMEKENDPIFEYVSAAAKIMNAITSSHGVYWFGWGLSTIALLRTGAVYGKHGKHIASDIHYFNEKSENLDLNFDVYLAADNPDKIHKVWRDLALLTTHFSKLLKCPVNNPEGVQDGCSVMTVSDKNGVLSKFRFTTWGPAIYNEEKNELLMTNSNLHVNHVFRLSRILPVAYASYYGLPIPVPNDPVFAFSHIIPMKGTPASEEKRYVFGQGCVHLGFPLITPEYKENDEYKLHLRDLIPTNEDLREIENCGRRLQEQQFKTFHSLCSLNQSNTIFVPLDVILDTISSNAVVYFEDFPNVVILQHGNGQYHLKYAQGMKQNPLSWSQYGQDRYIDRLLNERRNGFFVEIGGYDGETFSNTLFFEKERNWTGLLVEANPYKYESLQGKDRRCYMANACISNDINEMDFYIADGLTSGKNVTTSSHWKRLQNIFNENAHNRSQNHIGETVTVYCKPLQTIMDTIGTRHIDYFSLDVEGGELIILNSIEWHKLDIDLFTIETDQHRDEIINFMITHGYKMIAQLVGDHVFQKNAASNYSTKFS